MKLDEAEAKFLFKYRSQAEFAMNQYNEFASFVLEKYKVTHDTHQFSPDFSDLVELPKEEKKK